MRKREVESVLKTKLRLHAVDRSHHTHFQFSSTRPITLPTILALSKGDGEVTLTNQKGLARGLGLRLPEFQECSACHICGSVVLLALATELLKVTNERLASDPVVHGPGCRAMGESVRRLLDEVDRNTSLRSAERRVLQRVAGDLAAIPAAHFAGTQERLRALIEIFLGR
jgi:hypothetical protein